MKFCCCRLFKFSDSYVKQRVCFIKVFGLQAALIFLIFNFKQNSIQLHEAIVKRDFTLNLPHRKKLWLPLVRSFWNKVMKFFHKGFWYKYRRRNIYSNYFITSRKLLALWFLQERWQNYFYICLDFIYIYMFMHNILSHILVLIQVNYSFVLWI